MIVWNVATIGKLRIVGMSPGIEKKIRIVIHQHIVEKSLSVSVIVFSEEVHLNDSANIRKALQTK